MDLLEKILDIARFQAESKFNKLYEAIDWDKFIKDGKDVNKSREDLNNAFTHAYVSAHLAYYLGDKISLNLGYEREILTEIKEKHKFGSKNDAFLDTNRDLWNNKMGIEYAKRLKAQGKNLDEIAEEIFKNLIQKDSDFIVDYKNDKRRWKNATKEDIWKKAKEELINKKKINSDFHLKSVNSNSFLQIEKSIQDKLKDFPIKDEHLNYKFPELNFNLPPLNLNFKKTDSKQSLIQQKPSFNLENFNFTKEEIRQATNITLPSAITSHPEIVIKSNYDKATNTRVNNIDLNFGKITINSDEDIKNLAYYCCDLAHNLEQCVLSKIKRELQIKPN